MMKNGCSVVRKMSKNISPKYRIKNIGAPPAFTLKIFPSSWDICDDVGNKTKDGSKGDETDHQFKYHIKELACEKNTHISLEIFAVFLNRIDKLFLFLENTTSNFLMRKVDQVFGGKKMYKNQFFWDTISAVWNVLF